MNIFLSDPCPRVCAQNLDDKRVVKMVLETAQLLASACSSVGQFIGYKDTHVNHPCAVWARKSRSRFSWLVEHGLELCDEYQFRFEREHKSKQVIVDASAHRALFADDALLFDFNSSGFHTGDLFYDYKLCLVNKWRYKDRKPNWMFRGRPHFARELWAVNFNQIT